MEDTKTFVTNVRCDYRYIAKIAKYLASKGVFKGTTSILASEAIRILAHGISDKFNCPKYGEAIRDLRLLGYKEDDNKARYYKALTDAIKIEEGQEAVQLSVEQETARLVKEYNKKHSSNTPTIDKTALKSVIAPVEDEIESPQLKTRTSEDERADISKIRTAMSVPDGAPIEVLEENKPTPKHSEHPEQTQSPE